MSKLSSILFHVMPAVICAGLIGAVCFAASQPKGSDTKGRHYFRETCKGCHIKGAKGGEVSPLTRTQVQWRTYFEKGKHAGGSEPLTKLVSEDQLRDLQAFLINHAADSLQPETCGK
jgi:hypothetical protein